MSQPDVAQLGVLADLFSRALERGRPASVVVLGVAGGNGLDRVDRTVTPRVAGIDINPAYLDRVRERLSGLELHCGDLSEGPPGCAPFDLVHAALFFEHAGLCIDAALALVAPGGRLSVVLQLPSETAHGVSPTRFTSMQRLRDHFQFVDVDRFVEQLQHRGYHLAEHDRVALPAGKAFWFGVFVASAASAGVVSNSCDG